MEDQNEVVIVTNVYGDVCIRKARRKRQKLLAQELLYDYANNTTLHGLPYIARKGVTLIEKIFWLTTFIISICLCLYLISKVWFKWKTSPVIVTVSEELVPVRSVPFPSITICPQSKSKALAYNYTDAKIRIKSVFQNETTLNSTMKEEMAKFADVSLVCGVNNAKYFNWTGVFPHTYSNSSVYEHIKDVHLDYNDVFLFCFFRGELMQCSSLFSKIVTSEGICYNMNSISANEIFRTENLQKEYPYLTTKKPIKDWSMEHGYTDDEDPYPTPGAENDVSPDVEVVLQDYLYDRDHLCNAINSGFRVYIQHPADLPQSSLYYYAVINDQVSSMALSFGVLNTSESLREYDAKTRQCYFANERYLRYFKIYTASNCRLECLTNITIKTCGCVEFYMPYEVSNRICTIQNSSCLMKARARLRRQEGGNGDFKCDCLPSCNAVDYEAEILKTNYNLKDFIKVNNEIQHRKMNLTGRKFSKLEMYFKRSRFVSMRRSELFGVADFLANCGGLLGLFLGFSFLSLVEIFYFLTLRLCCTLKNDLEEEKAQHTNEKVIHLEKY